MKSLKIEKCHFVSNNKSRSAAIRIKSCLTILIVLSAIGLFHIPLTGQNKFLLKKINTVTYNHNFNNNDSNPREFTEFNSRLYFTATDGVAGRQLWSTDGSRAGTIVFTTGISDPTSLTVINNYLYFSALDSSGDRELYRTDGTSNSYTKIEQNTSGSTNPSQVKEAQGRIYFKGSTVSNGTQLCSFDPSTPSVIQVHSIGTNFNFSRFIVSGNHIYFISGSASAAIFYALDLSNINNVPFLIGTIPPGYTFDLGLGRPLDLKIAHNGGIYIAFYYFGSTIVSKYLTFVDYTGISVLNNIVNPNTLVTRLGRLYFDAQDPSNTSNYVLHEIDNTGTHFVHSSVPIQPSSGLYPHSLFIYDNIMYGWIKDGASNGIYKFHFNYPSAPSYSSSLPSIPTHFESSAYLNGAWFHIGDSPANSIGVYSIYKTSYLGTIELSYNNSDGGEPSDLTIFNNELYYVDDLFVAPNSADIPFKYDCDVPLRVTGVEIFKLTNSQIECQDIQNFYSPTILDGIYESRVSIDLGANLQIQGDQCVIFKSPSTTMSPSIQITPSGQLITTPGACH